jgi:hypothetical protein
MPKPTESISTALATKVRISHLPMVSFGALLLIAFGKGSSAVAADIATGDSSPSNAAFAEHLAQLRVPEGFTVVAQPPVVVIGDEPPAQVWLRATNTVKWAVDPAEAGLFPARSCGDH